MNSLIAGRKRRSLLAAPLLSAAVLATIGAGAASATVYTYTVPAGGMDINPEYAPFANPVGSTVALFNTVPYAAITSVTYSNVVVTTTGQAYPSDLYAGITTTFTSLNTGNQLNGLLVPTDDGSIFSLNGAGTSAPYSFGPATQADVYVQASGQVRFTLSNFFGPANFGSIHLDSGTFSVTVDELNKLTPATSLPTPTATTLSSGVQSHTTLTTGGVQWLKFQYGGGTVQINTLGSTISHAADGVIGDTTIGLYDASGQLVATNDDLDYNGAFEDGPYYESLLLFGEHDLAKGTYYLAVTGYSDTTEFANGFRVANSSDYSGNLQVNLFIDVPGDYNGDGIVDSADYTVWADHFGQSGTDVLGDGNGDGVVDSADYTVWADHFGQGVSPNASLVPEPAMASLLTLPALLLGRRRR